MASSSMADSTKTAAELMQERHEAAQNHHVTVEDTVDVDDLEHPPPPHTTSTPEPLKDISNSQPMSAKAAGKQRAHANAPALDTTDEEAFPSLGGTPKPRAAANTSSWTSKSFTTPAVNGTGPTTARQASSGTSTPSSNRGLGTPTYAQSARPSDFGQAPQPMSLPGQYQATFTFENEELNRETLTSQQIASLSKKYGVSITTRTKGGEKGTGSTYIDIRGSKGAVEKLRPEVEKIFSQTVTKDVSVPASIKSHIIGRGGSNIERLEKQFKVKLKIQDSKDRSPSEMATVKVSGYGPRVRSAVEAIRDLVKEKQPKVSLPVENVPPHVFPFINARHGPQIRQWQQEHGLQIEIPDSEQDAINARVPLRAPRRTPSVTVNGDLNAAKQAHSDLTKLIEALQDELQSQEHPFPRSSHPFIIGDRGVTQEDFLNETGCVILLPEDDSEDVIVWGPENRLDEGYNKIMELAGRLKRETVDIYKPFAAAPKGSEIHARAFQRYLHDRAVIEDLQRRHNADIVFPSFSDPSSYWTVVSEDQRGVLQGRSDLMKIIAAHPPERLSIIDEVDPFFHRHLSDMCEVALTDMGVRMILPDSADEHVVLVYEGAPQTPDTPFEVSRQKPSSEEIAEFQEALKEAYAHILGLIDDKEVAERSVPIPQKYHNDIRRYTDDLPKPAGSRFPIEVNFAAPLPRRLDLPDDVSPEDFIYLRGQGEDALEELQRQILQELSEIQENEKQRNHKTSFDFPDKLKDRLVGKGGAHINDLRKRFNVEIDTKSPGMVNIRGPPKYAKPCQAEISRLEKVWADEVTLRVKVDPRYVGQVIGTGGENLKKLRKRGNDQVDIRAPPSSKFDESQSIADTASDAGSTRAPRAKDEFIIRGPNKLALEIKSEIEHLYNYVKENSHEATVVVAKSQLPSLIGRGGTEIEQLRRETGARIDLPKNADSDRVPIVIKGTKQQVEKAKGEIQKRSKAFDDVVIRKVEIDQKHHPELIGPQGANLQDIIKEAGARSTEAVQFPKKGVVSNTVSITAPTAVADKLVTILERLAGEKANQVTDTVEVSVDKHRILIGQGGETRRALEQEYAVSLNVPSRNSGGTTVKISGPADNVARLKAEIVRRTAKQPGETVQVPILLHHEITENGRIFRNLRDRNVVIDHDGHRPPPRAESGVSTPAQGANGNLPLITDSADNLRHSWNLVQPPAVANGADATIPWIIRGPPEAVAAAKKQIEQRLEAAREPKATGYLKLSDPSLHRYIIGKGGSKIKEIRAETQCAIQVPKDSSTEGAITVVGTAEGCEQAKVLILEAAETGMRNGNA